jgi:hypothetical protein
MTPKIRTLPKLTTRVQHLVERVGAVPAWHIRATGTHEGSRGNPAVARLSPIGPSRHDAS